MATTNKAFKVKSGLIVEGSSLYPAAGTTSYAPIVLTSGTNLTTASAGAFEFDGTNFYLTPSTTRKTIAFTDSNITGSAGSVTNSITFNTSGGAAAGSTFNGSAARTIDYTTVGAAASSHSHGNITNAGAIGSTSGLMVKTTTSGVLTTLAAGSAGQFLQYDGTWATPTGATYDVLAVTTTGGAFLRLHGSDSTTDDVKFASGTNSTVAYTDANTITISSTDTNYYPTAVTYTGGTTAGPVATVAMTGASNITADAIPSASGSASGIVTTGAQTFGGTKTLTSPVAVTSLTTSSASFDLVNTTATTVNFAGAGTSVNIGASTGNTTVNNSLIVTGNLTVNGTTTTVNSTTVTVDDLLLELGAVTTPTDTTANGGGISLKGATDKTIIWDSANSNWTSSENWNLVTGKVFKINNVSVLSATTLGSAVVNSSLTKVGALSGGTAGFVKVDASGNLTSDSSTYLTSSTGVTTVNGASGAITNVALTTGKLSQFAATSSSELAGVISDETGSGALVFGTTPTIATPVLTGITSLNSNAGIVSGSGSGSTLFTISSLFDKTVYNGGEFTVKLSDGTDFEIIRLLVVIKGTTFYVTQYGDVTSNGSLGTIDFTLSTNNVNMTVTPVAGTVTAKVAATLLAA